MVPSELLRTTKDALRKCTCRGTLAGDAPALVPELKRGLREAHREAFGSWPE